MRLKVYYILAVATFLLLLPVTTAECLNSTHISLLRNISAFFNFSQQLLSDIVNISCANSVDINITNGSVSSSVQSLGNSIATVNITAILLQGNVTMLNQTTLKIETNHLAFLDGKINQLDASFGDRFNLSFNLTFNQTIEKLERETFANNTAAQQQVEAFYAQRVSTIQENFVDNKTFYYETGNIRQEVINQTAVPWYIPYEFVAFLAIAGTALLMKTFQFWPKPQLMADRKKHNIHDVTTSQELKDRIQQLREVKVQIVRSELPREDKLELIRKADAGLINNAGQLGAELEVMSLKTTPRASGSKKKTGKK